MLIQRSYSSHTALSIDNDRTERCRKCWCIHDVVCKTTAFVPVMGAWRLSPCFAMRDRALSRLEGLNRVSGQRFRTVVYGCRRTMR